MCFGDGVVVFSEYIFVNEVYGWLFVCGGIKSGVDVCVRRVL